MRYALTKMDFEERYYISEHHKCQVSGGRVIAFFYSEKEATEYLDFKNKTLCKKVKKSTYPICYWMKWWKKAS